MSDTIPQNIPLKQCKDCLQSFPATTEFFPPEKRGKLKIRCRPCNSAKFSKWREAHRQERINYCKTWRKENAQAVVSYNKTYKDAHQEELKAYREKTRDYHREVGRIYYRTHKAEYRHYRETVKMQNEEWREYYRAKHRERNARKKNAPGTHTVKDIQKQYERQRGKCYYCSVKIGKGKNAYHVDHVIPLTRGGSNDPSNLVITCPTCNLKKRDKLPHEWPEGGKLL